MLTVKKQTRRLAITPELFAELFDKMLALFEGGEIDTGVLAAQRERFLESEEMRGLLERIAGQPEAEEMRAIGEEMRQLLADLIPPPSVSSILEYYSSVVLEELPAAALPALCPLCAVNESAPCAPAEFETEGRVILVSVYVGQRRADSSFNYDGIPCRDCDLWLLRKYVELMGQEVEAS